MGAEMGRANVFDAILDMIEKLQIASCGGREFLIEVGACLGRQFLALEVKTTPVRSCCSYASKVMLANCALVQSRDSGEVTYLQTRRCWCVRCGGMNVLSGSTVTTSCLAALL